MRSLIFYDSIIIGCAVVSSAQKDTSAKPLQGRLMCLFYSAHFAMHRFYSLSEDRGVFRHSSSMFTFFNSNTNLLPDVIRSVGLLDFSPCFTSQVGCGSIRQYRGQTSALPALLPREHPLRPQRSRNSEDPHSRSPAVP